jgi:hypothetical protein
LVLSFLATHLPTCSHNMPWKAKSGCAEHHRAAVERLVNSLPLFYLLPPRLGEIFADLDDCTNRLRGYALAEGFDVVRHGGDTKMNPACRYKCIFYGINTQNHRKLEIKYREGFGG